jgi:hypothetical protein
VVEGLDKLKVVVVKSESLGVIVLKSSLSEGLFTIKNITTVDIRIRHGVVRVVSVGCGIGAVLEGPDKHLNGVVERELLIDGA